MGRERREFGSIRKLASGRHQAVYTGPDLLRHVAPTTFQAKIDAEGWLHEERKLIEANEWSTEAPGGKGASVGNHARLGDLCKVAPTLGARWAQPKGFSTARSVMAS